MIKRAPARLSTVERHIADLTKKLKAVQKEVRRHGIGHNLSGPLHLRIRSPLCRLVQLRGDLTFLEQVRKYMTMPDEERRALGYR